MPGLDDPDLPPFDGSTWLVDADAERRPRWAVVTVAVGAMALAGCVVVALRVLYTPPPIEEMTYGDFRADDEGAPGYEPPRLAGAIEPVIPAGLGGSRFEGDVVLGVVVDPEGRVSDVTVLQSLDPVLDAMASRAVWKASFQPARRGGVPGEARIVVKVPFKPF